EKDRLLSGYLPPSDRRIQNFLGDFLADTGLSETPRLPSNTLTLDRYGMARELSLPPESTTYSSPTLTSYRIRNGILHNPSSDRRTTEGVFHVADGGLPVPLDKKAVPKAVFGRILAAALVPPDDLMVIPFTALEAKPGRAFLSILLRPIVQPEVPGVCPERSMEIRFFAPGSLAANLDFVESIFGNSGDPYIAENDAALDPLHWTGHTGCIFLATHLGGMKKRDLGLPAWDDASERQRRDGMAWKDPEELYNEGKPFKICARNERGVIFTIIADNYFGYSKKEVKAQISYSSNLLGLTEEEHAGGALVIPTYNLGTRFVPDAHLRADGHDLEGVLRLLRDRVQEHPDGYALDLTFPNIVYLPEDAEISLDFQEARWTRDGKEHSLRILPHEVYVHPTGYKVRMNRHAGSGAWRLVGTLAAGLLCHKPCTVSGGGKSEISKSIWDAVEYFPFIIGDYDADMAQVKAILDRDYSDRFRGTGEASRPDARPILSGRRSLGSVIKLISPSPLYSDKYNAWLMTIPERIKALVFLVKRFYSPDWGDSWVERFTVDTVNGAAGNILKFEGRPVLGSYLRVGYSIDGRRRIFKLRQDFLPAEKVQWEDDITASIVLPRASLPDLPGAYPGPSVKFCRNTEARFFQRPDDAVTRGYDEQAEKDIARQDNFVSNFEPLTRSKAREMIEKSIEFAAYTEPMRRFIEEVEKDDGFEWFVASDRLRIVDGKPSKNPRYLQLDPNHVEPMNRYLADLGQRLYHRIPEDSPVYHPVGATLPGRRNNPADPAGRIRPLAVYGPLHFQELPELFMDFICSLTGKSPSTTGTGSEGALTKGPFNSLVPTTDLNAALLSYILTGHSGFSTAAGSVGRGYLVNHDISLLIPELWSRMDPEERDPGFLIAGGYLEKVEDFEYEGRIIPASRLGYRITALFASTFLGRIFDTPSAVFPDDFLRPEIQDLAEFVDGVENIAEAQARVARDYLADGSIEAAIPPLKAVLYVMAEGSWNGKTLDDPELRRLFNRDSVLAADWYRERLELYKDKQVTFLEKSIVEIRKARADGRFTDPAFAPRLDRILKAAEKELRSVLDPTFVEGLVGTLGADPLFTGRKPIFRK
ncbi:MAG TPA: hypothetical protein VLH39_06820, partial [Magnetospirillaceae bacterium]|nr:hypothetical protein [Magnetospirillaceae bacterium]